LELQDGPDPTSGSGEPAMTMIKAINYINAQLQDRMNLVFKYAAFIKDSEALFKQYELTLAAIFGSNLNPSV